MINRLRLALALALALPLTAFVQGGSSVGTVPALLPQEEGYEKQRAAAEGLVQEGSWQLALELYTRIDLSGLAEEDRRWVSFRRADLEWRSAAASRNPDPSRLDAGQRALRELAAPDARPADRDRVWAEVQESLGASHLMQHSFNWREGLRLTRLAMGWWASAPDVETARKSYAEKFPEPLNYLEGEIGDREFLVGDALSIADISLVCQLAQFELVAGPLDAKRWPGVAGLVERLTQRDSFTPCLTICRKIVKQDPIDLSAA